MPDYSINANRLNRTLAELGRIGATPQGMQRIAYSPADIAGREYALNLLRRAGLETRIDPAGNLIGRQPGSDPTLPPIALGSHTDTVPSGGRYDGALGVLGAIEAVQTLADNRHLLRHPVEVVVFTNEEGTTFHRWLLGSRAMAGLLEPEDLAAVDDTGVSFGTRLAAIGGDLSRIQEARRHPGDLAAYLELHIEQGPTLHQSGTPIGVVSGITGRAVFSVELQGVANHAGTTPMPQRRDALVAAAQVVLAVRRLAAEQEICRVATVGNLQVHPNAVNVVPGRVTLGAEFRDGDRQALAAAEAEFRRVVSELADASGVRASIEKLESTPAVPVAERMQRLVAEAASASGWTHQRLPSGAGHDAQAIAAIAPMAMIFVPSVGGVSHAPEEYTSPQDCANGAQVLLNLLLLADARL
jgi:N-carbamoyl-L-amino-acid hydrolase